MSPACSLLSLSRLIGIDKHRLFSRPRTTLFSAPRICALIRQGLPAELTRAKVHGVCFGQRTTRESLLVLWFGLFPVFLPRLLFPLALPGSFLACSCVLFAVLLSFFLSVSSCVDSTLIKFVFAGKSSEISHVVVIISVEVKRLVS